MSQEQDATLAGLETALKMEADGKAFYLKAAKASQNKLGVALFKNLADEEDIHREVFKNIYERIKKNEKWPEVKSLVNGGKHLHTVFAAAAEKMDKEFKPAQSELDAIKTGIDMENQTIDFYHEKRDKAGSKVEKQFYEELSMQESMHSRILQDYLEFYNDPAVYYTLKEHPSLDG